MVRCCGFLVLPVSTGQWKSNGYLSGWGWGWRCRGGGTSVLLLVFDLLNCHREMGTLPGTVGLSRMAGLWVSSYGGYPGCHPEPSFIKLVLVQWDSIGSRNQHSSKLCGCFVWAHNPSEPSQVKVRCDHVTHLD